MRLKSIIISSASIVFFLSLTSYAQLVRPKVPYIQHNICPFECCQYGKWIAKSLIKAYKIEGDDSAIAFTIKPGEELTSIGGNVHIVKLGELILNKSFDKFTRGDKIYVLSYRGEGTYDLWYKGGVLDLNSDSMTKVWANGKLMQSSEFIWWVFVKNKYGNQGWLKLKNISKSGFQIREKIDGFDSCS
jgi:hypothetical protein